jgi:hypothetical protein
MGETITFRVDAATAHILRELRKRDGTTNSEAIRNALRNQWEATKEEDRPTSWEVYQELYHLLPAPPKGQRLHDRACRAKRIVKEKLLAKRREGTL